MKGVHWFRVTHSVRADGQLLAGTPPVTSAARGSFVPLEVRFMSCEQLAVSYSRQLQLYIIPALRLATGVLRPGLLSYRSHLYPRYSTMPGKRLPSLS